MSVMSTSAALNGDLCHRLSENLSAAGWHKANPPVAYLNIGFRNTTWTEQTCIWLAGGRTKIWLSD